MCGASGLTRIHLDPLRDAQQEPVYAYCRECGGEIYDPFSLMPGHLCGDCYWEERKLEETKNLIQVIQLPVIEERLRSMKETVDKQVNDALSLVCTEDTVLTVKGVRSALNKQFQVLEEQRKEVKKAVLGPYEQFEAVYKECVSDRFKSADVQLKKKIGDVESEMKQRCEDGLREYFAELCAAEHVEWLTYDRAGIVVDMASAKAKTPKKLREQLVNFVAEVSRGVSLISGMEDAEEIMVEFKRTLDAAQAISTVQERHRRIEAEKEAKTSREAVQSREQVAAKKVEEVAPPIIQPPTEATAATEQIFKCTFTVRATKPQLRKLKEFLKQEGIQYE